MLVFPLALADFADGLRVRSFDWDLTENRRITESGGGELLISDLGPRLWQGSVEIAPDTHRAQQQAQALAQALRSGGRAFFLSPYKGQYPFSDPAGALIAAATPTLKDPAAGSDIITISGMPAGYKLTAGDYLSFEYGSSPVRHALHQVFAVSGPASGGGEVSVQVVPQLRRGATDGLAVNFVKPSCKALMVPGSFKSSTLGLSSASGFSFQFRQTLR